MVPPSCEDWTVSLQTGKRAEAIHPPRQQPGREKTHSRCEEIEKCWNQHQLVRRTESGGNVRFAADQDGRGQEIKYRGKRYYEGTDEGVERKENENSNCDGSDMRGYERFAKGFHDFAGIVAVWAGWDKWNSIE